MPDDRFNKFMVLGLLVCLSGPLLALTFGKKNELGFRSKETILKSGLLHKVGLCFFSLIFLLFAHVFLFPRSEILFRALNVLTFSTAIILVALAISFLVRRGRSNNDRPENEISTSDH